MKLSPREHKQHKNKDALHQKRVTSSCVGRGKFLFNNFKAWSDPINLYSVLNRNCNVKMRFETKRLTCTTVYTEFLRSSLSSLISETYHCQLQRAAVEELAIKGVLTSFLWNTELLDFQSKLNYIHRLYDSLAHDRFV